MNNKKEEFSKSVGYLVISQALIKILGLAYSLYLINKKTFGDKGNAIYLSSFQIFAFMITFSSIGVPNAVSNLIAKCNNHKAIDKVFLSAIITYVSIACFFSLILFSFSNYIAFNFLKMEYANYNLKLLAPLIIVSTLESIYIGYFNGIKQMKVTAKIQFIEQLFKTVMTILVVDLLSKITTNPYALSIGATLGVVFSMCISIIFCFRDKKKIPVYSKEFFSEDIKIKEIIKCLLKFSIPISISAMFVGINKNSDSFSIINILGNKIGFEEAQKIYGVIASKVDVLISLPLAFNLTLSTALIPNISEARKNNDTQKIKEYVENVIFFSLGIGMAFSGVLYFFAGNIFDLLFKNSARGIELLKISSFSVAFSILNQTFTGILQSLEKNKIPMIVSFIGMIVKVFFNIILVNYCMEYGIIVSSIISNLIIFLILYIMVRKNFIFKFKKFFFIAGSIIFFMIFCMKKCIYYLKVMEISEDIAFVFSCILGCLIYFLGVFLYYKNTRKYKNNQNLKIKRGNFSSIGE